jgi:hypothetical protein
MLPLAIIGFTLLVALGLGGWSLRSVLIAQRQRRAEALTLAERLLTAARLDPASAQTAGHLDGFATQFRLTSRGSGSATMAWTEVEVSWPRAEFSLELRRQSHEEERLRRRGLALTIEVGESAFDREYVVEAAPAEVARALLTPALRAELRAAGVAEVTTPEPGRFRLGCLGWAEEPEAIGALLGLAARLAAGVSAAFSSVDEASEAALAAGAPYRPQVPPEELARVRAARAAELDALDKIRRERREASAYASFVWSAAVIGALVTSTLIIVMWSR